MGLLRNLDWEKVKIIVEVVAILAAGMFALFTWGIDAARLSAPNWAVTTNSKQLAGVKVNGKFKPCSNANCPEATTCQIEGSVVTTNTGNTSLGLRETLIDFYIMDRENSTGMVDLSSYKYFIKRCKKGERQRCTKADLSFKVGEIDEQPLFPNNSGMRPFVVQFTPSEIKGSWTIDSFAQSKQVFIVATQKIDPGLWRQEEESKATLLIDNVCYRNYFKSDTTE